MYNLKNIFKYNQDNYALIYRILKDKCFLCKATMLPYINHMMNKVITNFIIN